MTAKRKRAPSKRRRTSRAAVPAVLDRDALMVKVCTRIEAGATLEEACKAAGSTLKQVKAWWDDVKVSGAIKAAVEERRARREESYSSKAFRVVDLMFDYIFCKFTCTPEQAAVITSFGRSWLIFFFKTQCKWSERVEHDHSHHVQVDPFITMDTVARRRLEEDYAQAQREIESLVSEVQVGRRPGD